MKRHRNDHQEQPSSSSRATMSPGKRSLTDHLGTPLQAKRATSTGDEATGASPASGQALRPDVRADMEASFGADFSSVRVVEGGLAEAMGAHAFARGDEIHMAAGRHAPDTRDGRELLGHELAHVVQQSQGRVSATGQAKAAAINDDPALEAEADRAGERAARGEAAGIGAPGAIGATPRAPLQGKFALLQPDNDDSYVYGWVDGDDGKTPPRGNFQWVGNFADLGGSPGDLLLDLDDNKLYRCRNMFGKSAPQPWVPNDKSPADQVVIEQARANIAMHMRKQEPTPSGDIGKMDFRFPAAGGALYYVGHPPGSVDPSKHTDVLFVAVDASTLEAHAKEHQVDRLGSGYDQSNYAPGKYLYVRRPQSVVETDDKPRNERSKFVFKGGSFDNPTKELHDQLVAAADLLDTSGGALQAEQTVRFTSDARGKSRDDGQCAAMQGMNAAAYALARHAPGADSTDWEWLHIRGARLGGATTAANLVAGTSSANSAMIPYEHQILEMSRWASSKQPLDVTWRVTARGRLGVAIEITWSAPAGLTRDDGGFMKSGAGERCVFNPQSAEIFDRVSRDIVWHPPRVLPPVPLWSESAGGASGGDTPPGPADQVMSD
jgi:hypothetical protein